MGPKKKRAIDQISSPMATGGGGTLFEQHANAWLLSLLLVRAIPPILIDSSIQEVQFQTELIGWRTDDALLTAKRSDGQLRKFAMQHKRTFSVSRNNDDCKKTFRRFWEDFHNPKVFNVRLDCLGLVLLQSSGVILTKLGGLFDCARSSRSGKEFWERLETPGLLNSGVKEYGVEIAATLQEAASVSYSLDSFWQFLRSIHLVCLDLTTATRQTESAIRTLLSNTSVEADPVSSADATWNALVQVASAGMPSARRFRYEDLPKELLERHPLIKTENVAGLGQLRDHSDTILRSIRDKFSSQVHLPRSQFVDRLSSALASPGVCIVSGPAGIGKSVVASDALKSLIGSSLVFAFRAEELAVPHLDRALRDAHLPFNVEQLRGVLAGQSKKVILIESVERLLEASTRDAFSDLMRMVEEDGSWHVVLTCRDYSVETVRSALLNRASVDLKVIEVEGLNDSEIDAVIMSREDLKPPAANERLRNLLRNPYFLEKALAMSWSAGSDLPEDERAFRAKFWGEVVRRDNEGSAGFAARRGMTFNSLCIRRAQSLNRYASCENLDLDALDALRRDGLINFSEQSNALAAPSHDVLEDWATLFWVDEQRTKADEDVVAFALSLGTFPAIRRTFRRWFWEMLLAEPEEARSFVVEVVQAPNVPGYFKDDTLVAVLESGVSFEVFKRISPQLVADNGSLLRRVIHLVRVACKEIPVWIPKGIPPLFLQPAGSGWAAVVKIVRENLGLFGREDFSLITGLLKEWSRLVTVAVPDPDGTAEVAEIIHALLVQLGPYGERALIKRLMVVLSTIPTADKSRYLALIDRASSGDDVFSECLIDIVFGGFESFFTLCAFPRESASLILTKLRRSDGEEPSYYEIDEVFGLSSELRQNFYPASALQGPFFSLLSANAEEGISLIVDLLNHSAKSFADVHPKRWVTVSLNQNGGGSIKQLCSGELWGMYRGMGTSPHVIQCALMALESWLLDLCEKSPSVIPDRLNSLIARSNNVATTAVVASIVNAKPEIAPDVVLTLLSSPTVVRLDRERWVHELHCNYAAGAARPHKNDVMTRVYVDERKRSAELAHRRVSLEETCFKLQFGSLKGDIQGLLDSHASQLPELDVQTESDKEWRVALHRMDVRKHVACITSQSKSEGSGDSNISKVVFTPAPLDQDLAELSESRLALSAASMEGAGLSLWASKALDRENGSGEGWRLRLAEAIALSNRTGSFDLNPWLRQAPSQVAAVCARDHWLEMDAAEQEWCDDLIRESLSVDTAHSPEIDGSLDLSEVVAPSAFALSAILADRQRLTDADGLRLSAALCHPDLRTRQSAAVGAGRLLIAKHRDAMLRIAMTLTERYRDRSTISGQKEAIASSVVTTQEIDSTRLAAEIDKLNLIKVEESSLVSLLLLMFGQSPQQKEAQHIVMTIARLITRHWVAAGATRRRNRELETEFISIETLASFILSTESDTAEWICDQVLSALDVAPERVGLFFSQLTIEADKIDNPKIYWSIWKKLSDLVVAKHKSIGLGNDRGVRTILETLFLHLDWKEGIVSWRHLAGRNHLIDDLFVNLVPYPTAFLLYTRYLYEVGNGSLPGGFVLIRKHLSSARSHGILSDPNVTFYLETTLKRWVYGKPSSLKSSAVSKTAVLSILDELIEVGSSESYRMRDDFVTP